MENTSRLSVLTTNDLRRILLRRVITQGQELLETLGHLEDHWNPPESGPLAEALVILKRELAAPLALARERLKLETET